MNKNVRDCAVRVGAVVALVAGVGAGAAACGGSSGGDGGAEGGGSADGPEAPAAEVAAVAAAPCEGWEVETLADGLGAVENALVLRDGTVLLTLAERGQVARLDEGGAVTPVVEGLTAPGGLASDGTSAYVTTGLTGEATISGVASGTIVRFDPETGDQETWATGLVSPNGLAILPDGGAVTTRTASGGANAAEVTRVTAGEPGATDLLWSDLTSTNGVVLAPGGDAVYVTRSLADRAEVRRIPLDDPAATEVVADLGVGTDMILDDLAVSEDGTLYVAAWADGGVHRVDPDTGEACAVATGIPNVTSVEVGPGGDHLIATSQAGSVSALRPPA